MDTDLIYNFVLKKYLKDYAIKYLLRIFVS